MTSKLKFSKKMFPEILIILIFIISNINLRRSSKPNKFDVPDAIKGCHPVFFYLGLALAFLLLSFSGPIQEEFFFRYILTRFLCHYPFYPYIISLLFGVVHLFNYSILKPLYSSSNIIYILLSQVTSTFFLGLCLQGVLQPDPETCLITLPELSYVIFLHGTYNLLGSIHACIVHWDRIAEIRTDIQTEFTQDPLPLTKGSYMCRHARDDTTCRCKGCPIKYRHTKDPDLQNKFDRFGEIICRRRR